jgi:hypothetical protein
MPGARPGRSCSPIDGRKPDRRNPARGVRDCLDCAAVVDGADRPPGPKVWTRRAGSHRGPADRQAAAIALQPAWRCWSSTAGACLAGDCFLRARSAGHRISVPRPAGLRPISRPALPEGLVPGDWSGSRSSMTVKANSSSPATGKQRISVSASATSTALHSCAAWQLPGSAPAGAMKDLRGDFPPPVLPGSGCRGRLVSLSDFGFCPPPWYRLRRGPLSSSSARPAGQFRITDARTGCQRTKVPRSGALGPLCWASAVACGRGKSILLVQ